MLSLRNLALLVVLASSAWLPPLAFAKKCKSDRDIGAIGHRQIPCGVTNVSNWYSVEKEKQLGTEMAAGFDKNIKFVDDAPTVAYINRLAQNLLQNSDSRIPITLRVVDSDDVYGITLAGGYQYLTRGLILKMQSEGELASALARGIAHTAMRSATRELTQANLIGMVMIAQRTSSPANSTSAYDLANSLTLLSLKRDDELRADYFGTQYLYKAGYDPECFIRFVQTVWPVTAPTTTQTSKAFSTFPPTPARIKTLREEIEKILPSRNGAVADTPEFREFREHLLSVTPPTSAPPATVPILHRGDQ